MSEDGATIGGVGERVPVSEAARRYGAAPRTVKRWKATGVANGDPCPLEDPEAMLAWWQRNMTQRAPDGINQAVRAWRQEHGEKLELVASMPYPAVPVKLPAPAVVEEPAVEDDGEGGSLEVGLEVELGNLERLAATLAKVAHQPGQTKPYLDTLARITALSRGLREEGEKIGKLVPRQMVEEVLRGLHAAILGEFRGMYRPMCEACGVVPTTNGETKWNEQVDELCERLGRDVLT